MLNGYIDTEIENRQLFGQYILPRAQIRYSKPRDVCWERADLIARFMETITRPPHPASPCTVP